MLARTFTWTNFLQIWYVDNFPTGHLLDWHFLEDRFPTDTTLNGNFSDRYFSNWTSPTGRSYFPYWTSLRPETLTLLRADILGKYGKDMELTTLDIFKEFDQFLWKFAHLQFSIDALCNLVLFVHFKKREKHSWRIANFSTSACNFTKTNTSPWVFFTFFKMYKWYQIA